jgi:catalase
MRRALDLRQVPLEAEAGLQSTVVWDEALKLAGADPTITAATCMEAIEAGDFPGMGVGRAAVRRQEFADALPFDVLDATKLIPEERSRSGRRPMVLDRNPDNFFAETEQVAFCPANIVPGIDFTNDPLLQGRCFSYLDTQLSRLGTANFHQIPINAPKCPLPISSATARCRCRCRRAGPNYEPNSLGPPPSL